MKKLTITNIEMLNIVEWYNNMDKDSKDALPVKTYYALKRAIAAMMGEYKNVTDVRDDKNKQLREKYFSEEMSEPCVIPKLDDNGEPILDENGAQITEEGRRVKKEYEQEFRDEQQKMNEEFAEVLAEKNTYTYNTIDFDCFRIRFFARDSKRCQ